MIKWALPCWSKYTVTHRWKAWLVYVTWHLILHHSGDIPTVYHNLVTVVNCKSQLLLWNRVMFINGNGEYKMLACWLISLFLMLPDILQENCVNCTSRPALLTLLASIVMYSLSYVSRWVISFHAEVKSS